MELAKASVPARQKDAVALVCCSVLAVHQNSQARHVEVILLCLLLHVNQVILETPKVICCA
uniref:Uncharacterized protein n=1 Tax=Setaria italica TaxID=4555 RepID=K3ZZH8_SETIT